MYSVNDSYKVQIEYSVWFSADAKKIKHCRKRWLVEKQALRAAGDGIKIEQFWLADNAGNQISVLFYSDRCLFILEWILWLVFQMENRSGGQILVNEIISQIKATEVGIFTLKMI